MMIEVLSAYRFLRRMEVGQFLFMWEIATKLHVSGCAVCENQNIRPEPVFSGFRTDVLLAKHIFLVELKDRSPVCRQRIREGVWLAIALALLGAGGECMLAALVEPMLGIQDQGVGSGLRNAYPVILSCNRREVDNKKEILLTCFIPSDKAENTPVTIVGIDPLKTVPVIIQPVERRIFPVNVKEIAEIFLQIMVAGLIREMPV